MGKNGNGNAVLEWEWLGMGTGMIRWEWEENGNKKVIPAHLYSEPAPNQLRTGSEPALNQLRFSSRNGIWLLRVCLRCRPTNSLSLCGLPGGSHGTMV